jgi:hypothetical protein
MSFQEIRSIVDLVGTVLITAVYSAVMSQRFPEASPYSPEIFRFWGAFVLILIPVSIAAKIVIYIVFYIINAIATREEEAPITDERDKLIELKAQTISNYVFIVGFILAMSSLVFDLPPSVMFILLFLSGLLSQVVSDIATFLFYRRGV